MSDAGDPRQNINSQTSNSLAYSGRAIRWRGAAAAPQPAGGAAAAAQQVASSGLSRGPQRFWKFIRVMASRARQRKKKTNPINTPTVAHWKECLNPK